jgi:hypothetical protein
MSNVVFGFTCPSEQTIEQIEQCAKEIVPSLRQQATA